MPHQRSEVPLMETFFVRKQLIVGALVLVGLEVGFTLLRLIAR